MVLSMERWVGKVVLVTGASAGCGAAIVTQLVENGLKVVGLARRKEKVEEIAKSLEGKSGKLYPYAGDVTKEEDILNCFKWTKENVGPISILINNAGIKRNTNLISGDTDLWRETFETNVIGLCIATREAVKDMQANNIDGHIIHINSLAGHRVSTVVVTNVYPASKFAVTALTETLRMELNSIGSKIKITSISPGAVKTEFRQASNLKEDEEKLSKKPILLPSDVVDAVFYALSTPPHVQVHDILIHPI
ncbi:hypothetical protein RN001_013611 [Aquatica leii]|uniref:Dehydrogenase/reductase SDR family member 11 n=1 Tax=Aquatica leii TaxID=1421715 RepID=A0AAN7P4N8_9COLE|nr:hypothetical protein RN001_013611 [Aquatica leii]